MELRTAFPTAVALGCVLGAALANAGSRSTDSQTSPVASLIQPAQEVIHWDLPVVWNASVARFVNLFETEQTDRMALYLKRSGRYEGMIRNKLRERGMPEDLLYLSMIESGFNPNALSRAKAVGLWQFMAGTARDYGLRVDGYVDERRDPERSTDAALRYLQHLYKQFGSWNLAAAAYNTGEGRVARIMREETGAVRGEEADFWRIRDRLPGDTREYVPLMFAMALIGKEPHKYGLENVERWLPVPTDTVMVPGGTDLERVARAVQISEDELRQLNPQLVQGITPPSDERYPVSIPDGRAQLFAANFTPAPVKVARKVVEQPKKVTSSKATASKTGGSKAAQRAEHRVRQGESLWTIAKRHGVSVTALRRVNGLKDRAILRPGQVLRIPA